MSKMRSKYVEFIVDQCQQHGITTSRTHSSTNNGPMNSIKTQVNDDVPEEHNNITPETEDSVVAEKRATDELK